MNNIKHKVKAILGNRCLECLLAIYEKVHIATVLVTNTFLRLFFIRNPKYNKKYKISICGIFKDEASFFANG